MHLDTQFKHKQQSQQSFKKNANIVAPPVSSTDTHAATYLNLKYAIPRSPVKEYTAGVGQTILNSCTAGYCSASESTNSRSVVQCDLYNRALIRTRGSHGELCGALPAH